MLKVLFIEDQPDSIKPIVKSLNRNRGDHEYEIKDFSEAANAIETFYPDIIVLDLLAGGSTPEPETPGLDTYDVIWNARFCPIIVYSAHPDVLTNDKGSHPFVKIVQKGRYGSRQVKAAITDLMPQVEALRQAEQHIRKEFALALRDVAPYAFKTFSGSAKVSERNEMVIRAGRRRLAAQMDGLSRSGQELVSWEQYLWPPICADLLLGDVLHEVGHPSEDPNCFRIVITPSCDLVASNGRSPKVKSVLVARCHTIKKGIQGTSLGNIGASKLKGKLQSDILTHGFFETILPFPELPERIPHMVADLRDLELIPFEQIVGSNIRFERVASIDSPFRELVSWAYMQIACRPGMPDRDFKGWCQGIMSGYEKGNESS